MKTLTIRDEVYEKLSKLKREGESFSDLLERLLERKRPSLRDFLIFNKDFEKVAKYLDIETIIIK